MPLIVLALAAAAPTADARDAGTPLPPLAVEATAAGAGTLVTWLPPLSEGAGPLVAYHVYRLAAPDGGLWEKVGSAGPDSLSFLDSAPVGSVYSVTAENAHGASLQSAPAASSAACSVVGLSGTPPQPVINWDCLDALLPGDGTPSWQPCDVIVLAGTPPQPVVNWDCLGAVVRIKVLDLRG